METPSTDHPQDPASTSRILPGFCVLLFILFTLPLLNPHAEFYRWDTWIYLWPLLLELKSQWMAGQVPFWISNVCGGTPLLANINAAALYPLRIIHYFVPLPFGYNLFVLTHWVLSFAFTFLWLRRGVGTSARGAVLAAMVYCFSGYARGMWDTHNFTIMPWIPLWFLALSLGGRDGMFTRASLLAAAAWLMMILCGDTQQAVLAGLAGGAYCVMLPERKKRLPVLVLAAVTGSLLGAPQWLPTLHAAGESYRSAGLPYAEAVERSMHPLRTVEFAVPYLFGTHEVWHAPSLFGEGTTRNTPWSASHHVGLLPWMVAGILLFRRKRPETWWALALGLAAVTLSLGRFIPGYAAWQNLPIIEGFRYPEKYLFWLPVAFAVFSGLGHDAFLKVKHLVPLPRWVTLCALSAACMILVGSAWWGASTGMPAAWIRNQILLSLVYFILLLIPLRSPNPSGPLLGVLLIQLLIPWYQEQPLSSRLNLNEPPPLARIILDSNDAQGRYLPDPAATVIPLPAYWNTLTRPTEQEYCYYASGLRINTARLWGLRTMDGFSPLEQMDTRAYRITSGRPMDGTVPSEADFTDYVRSTGVRWLLTTPTRWEAFQTLGLAGDIVRYWNPSGDTTLLVHLSNTFESAPSPAYIERSSPGHIRIQLLADTPYPLRIAESASAGWTVADNRPALSNLQRGKNGFLELTSFPDDHVIDLVYKQPGWMRGLQLHLLGWAAIAGLVLGPKLKQPPGSFTTDACDT